jgi:hypothetical protein
LLGTVHLVVQKQIAIDGPKRCKRMIDAGIIYFTLKSLKAEKRRYTCTLANAPLFLVVVALELENIYQP